MVGAQSNHSVLGGIFKIFKDNMFADFKFSFAFAKALNFSSLSS